MAKSKPAKKSTSAKKPAPKAKAKPALKAKSAAKAPVKVKAKIKPAVKAKPAPKAKASPIVKAVGKIAGKALSALTKKEKTKPEVKAKVEKKAPEKKVKEVVLKPKAPAKPDKVAAGKKEEKNLKGTKFPQDKKSSKKNDYDEEELEAGPKKKSEDDDDDEEDFKRIASKAKKISKFENVDFDEKPSKGYKKFDQMGDLENKISEEIAELRENFSWKEIAGAINSLEFFIEPKNDECIEKGCDNIRTTLSWCRLHYLKNWKTIQRKKEILQEGKLQEYIEELISKYPPKYIDAILNDLSDDKDFFKVLNELNISNDFDFEEDELEAVDDDGDDDDLGIEARFTGSMKYEDTE